MRILYLITRAERGGAQVHLLDLLSNLPEDIEPLVVTGEQGFLCDECNRLGVRVQVVPFLIHPIHPLKDLQALVAILRVIRSEFPDVIHAHTSKAGLLARLAGRLTGTSVVFTAHTWSFADGISALQKVVTIPIERFAARHGGVIIAVSEANRRAAIRESVGRPDSLIRVWNGIPDVSERAFPGSNEMVTLIVVARFVQQKDHELLFHALAGMSGKWRLVLAGDGPNRDSLEQLASELGLQERVEFAGDRNDIPLLLARSDLFVLPSKWEGLPLSILEAMRAGLPVIASDVGGVSETVTHGDNGFLVARGDVAGMRMRIEQLINNPRKMREMGESGRHRYELDFRLQTMLEETWSVYKGVAIRRRPVLEKSEVAAR